MLYRLTYIQYFNSKKFTFREYGGRHYLFKRIQYLMNEEDDIEFLWLSPLVWSTDTIKKCWSHATVMRK